MPYKLKKDLYDAQKRHRIGVRAKLFEYLCTQSCKDCGETDPVVLDFDHRDRTKKFKDISRMLSGHYSWLSVQREIVKCDVRCANCHRRRTYHQMGHWGKSAPS